jgi:K+-transporting ATPase ATPase C chain
MLKELGPVFWFRWGAVFTVLTGFLYPAAITGVSALLFPKQSSGSLVTVNGKVVGSSLIGQSFSNAEYFHPRPSSAGSGYDASASSGSNLGPSSAKLINGTTKMDDKGRKSSTSTVSHFESFITVSTMGSRTTPRCPWTSSRTTR